LIAHIAAALATGNRAVIANPALRGELIGLPERVAARLSWADDWRKAGPYSGALIEGDAAARSAALAEIAALPGPIVLAQAGAPRLDWLVEEVSTSVNTTAAGGNASLMAVA
jgi:RHH-type proline utilization regulon transcriptional repressor/proline dehydrogenase/delta 1-pyrroline-5-carboxylate dehydrogenase